MVTGYGPCDACGRPIPDDCPYDDVVVPTDPPTRACSAPCAVQLLHREDAPASRLRVLWRRLVQLWDEGSTDAMQDW